MNNSFIALDVETANAWYGSICQIGLARSIDGNLVNEWSFLINPKTYFDSFNTNIHGITEESVADAPTISELWDVLTNIIGDNIVAHHGPFDRASIAQCIQDLPVKPHQFRWLDTSRVVRRHWNEVSKRGYGLRPVCDMLGYEFQHHDALEDAKAAAFILNHVIKESGQDLDWWWERALQRCSTKTNFYADIGKNGNPDGILAGETVVFTGALSLSRQEIAEIAASHGCNVAANVTKKVTMLVVGEQDPSKLSGFDKSSKQRKAEDLIAKGQPIQILGEEGFISALQLDDTEQTLIEERAAEKARKRDQRNAREKRSLTIEINLYGCLPDELKANLAQLAEYYEQNPEAVREDEIIDSFADMSLGELTGLDRSELSDYVLDALDDEVNFRIEE